MNFPEDTYWKADHEGMVEQLRRYHIRDERILAAMGRIRRHRFIPEVCRHGATAYGDHPWPIGHDQTISQPFVVAYMTERLAPVRGDKVLEIGTGSGYQAAILAELGTTVFTIELIPELAAHAQAVLEQEGYQHVTVRTGNGYRGWPEESPFDIILATCAPEYVPRPLIEQLAEGGRMILPIGSWSQRLVILRRDKGRITEEEDIPVRFVPMVHSRPFHRE